MIHLTALALYGVAFALWLRSFLSGSAVPAAALAGGAAGAGVAFHFVGLASFSVESGTLPLAGLGPSLSSLALLLGGGLVSVALRGEEASRIGLLLTPVILVLQGTAIIVGIFPTSPTGLSGWFVVHVALALLGFQGLAIAAAAGALYLLQFQELKGRRFGRIARFVPPLAFLDRLVAVGLAVGASAMTGSLVLGWIWTRGQGGILSLGDPKIVWALLSWGVLWITLSTRFLGAHRGIRSARLSVAGFALVVTVYLALRIASGTAGRFL